MKLLCMHGYGTNADCLRSQLLPLMNALGGDHETVFLEGEKEVAKSVFSGDFPPPYYAYFEGVTSAEIAKVHKLMEETIEQDGPFDGIIGFSQGAGVAISYLLNQQIKHPEEPPPFKFGVFFSSSITLSPDPTYKEEELMSIFGQMKPNDIEQFHQAIMSSGTNAQFVDDGSFLSGLNPTDRHVLSQIALQASGAYMTRTHLAITFQDEIMAQLSSNDSPSEGFPRFYNPVYTSHRLSIPTVHSWGRNDIEGLRRLALICRDLCSDGRVMTVEHGGQHEVPMDKDAVASIANAVEKAIYIGQQQAIMV